LRDLQSLFGIDSDTLARLDQHDPQTGFRTYATTESGTSQPPDSPVHALLDPKGSAIFWIAAAGVLGLVLVTGQLKVEAAVGGRAGRR
jgi:hypothetical protein